MLIALIVLSVLLLGGLIAFLVFALSRKKKTVNPPVEEKKEEPLDLEKVQEIRIQGEEGDPVRFTRPLHLNGSYREVMAIQKEKRNGVVAKGAVEVGKKVYSIAELQAMSPNGIFSASASAATLSHLLSGKAATSFVTGSEAAGAISASAIGSFNPIGAIGIGIQAMALVSGQYYLHRIYEQLGKFSESVDRLMLMHDEEAAGTLLHTQKRLRDLASRKNVDEVDLQEARLLRQQCGSIFEEYRIRYERERDALLGSEIHSLKTQERLKRYEEKMDGVRSCLELCLAAERLEVQSEVAEIAIRNQIDALDPTIEELLDELKSHLQNGYAEELKSHVTEEIARYRNKGVEVIGNARDYGVFKKDKNRLLERVDSRLAPLERSLKGLDHPIAERLLSQQSQDQEIVLVYEENSGKTRAFLPQKEKAE